MEVRCVQEGKIIAFRPGLFYKQSSRKALGFLVPWVPV